MLRPVKKFDVDRLERDISKLDALYMQGYNETMAKIDDLKKWLENI